MKSSVKVGNQQHQIAVFVGMVIGRHQIRPGNENPRLNEHSVVDAKNSAEERMEQASKILDRLNIGDEKLLAVVEVNDQGRIIHLPVIQSNKLAQYCIRHPVASIPSQQIQAANRLGWNLTQERRLLAIERSRNQVEVVPVGLVRLKSVGRALF